MSLDYPFYEKLRASGHSAARWWRIGDVVYYGGVLVGILGTPAWPALAFFHGGRSPYWFLAGAIATLALGVIVAAVGVWAKREAYRRAALDGVHPG